MKLSYNTVAMLAFLRFSDASEAIEIYFRYRGEVNIVAHNGLIEISFD